MLVMKLLHIQHVYGCWLFKRHSKVDKFSAYYHTEHILQP